MRSYDVFTSGRFRNFAKISEIDFLSVGKRFHGHHPFDVI